MAIKRNRRAGVEDLWWKSVTVNGETEKVETKLHGKGSDGEVGTLTRMGTNTRKGLPARLTPTTGSRNSPSSMRLGLG